MYVAYHRVLSCALRFRVWMLSGYVWSQESDSMILVDPFQLRILCDWSHFLLKQFVHFWWVFHVRDMSLYLPSLHLLQPWSYPDSSIKERVRPMVSCAIEKIVKNTHLQKKKNFLGNTWGDKWTSCSRDLFPCLQTSVKKKMKWWPSLHNWSHFSSEPAQKMSCKW